MQHEILIGGIIVCMIVIAFLCYLLRLHKRHNRALVETNATKDKLLSIISHDLKTPAIALRDAIQMLLENSGNWDSELLTRYYQTLFNAANDHAELIHTLLNWAQMQAPPPHRGIHIPCRKRLFDLIVALKSDINIIQSMAEKKGILLDVRIPASAYITGDDNILTIVIRNLLMNAIKFTAPEGTVKLEIKEINGIKGYDDKEIKQYIISVSDTGVGISEIQLNRLFCLESAYSGMGTAGEKGTGLGIIVCKELLEKHGSKLYVESEEGKGSRFWFEIVVND